MKNFLLSFLLVLASCQIPSVKPNLLPLPLPQPKTEFSTEDYFKNSLEFFTFDLKTIVYNLFSNQMHEAYGKGFIADKSGWTASHVYGTRTTPDILNLGDSPIWGLTICPIEHTIGDFAYFKTRNRGKIKCVILKAEEHQYEVTLESPMKKGDSGSPVLCNDHTKVVGIVSSFWSNHKKIKLAGNIARLKKK